MKPFFEANGISLYHGDCRDVLPCLEPQSVDLLLTDPPYGMQFSGHGTTTQQANIRGDGARQGVRVVRQALFELGPLLKPDAHAYVFCHWESWPDFYDACCAFFPIKNALVWWKNRGGMGDMEMEYARDYEVILYGASGRRPLSGRRDGAVLSGFSPVGNDRQHPTQKPVALLQHLLAKSCPVGGRTLDPFCGVGPTLLAALRTGRNAIGIELDERWCEIGARNIEQAISQGELFSPAAIACPPEKSA